MTWHKRFIDLADHIATWSKDDSTKVGCVIVGPDHEVRSLGFNGAVRGHDDNDPELKQRPAKYLLTEHAERNAIYNAARVGTPTRGCTLYCSFHPCMDCARAIVQAGIECVVTRKPDLGLPVWGEHFRRAVDLFHQVKVQIIHV